MDFTSALTELEHLFKESEEAKARSGIAARAFEKKDAEIQESLWNGHSTGDQILDWALSNGYPYQENKQKAQMVYDYLQEHVGDYFFFLGREYWRPFIWDIHVGKIGSPPLLNREGQLSLVVEEGTLMQKKVAHYTDIPLVNNIFPNEKKEPSIQGLFLTPFQRKELIESISSCWDDSSDSYYILGAGEKTVLSYLHQQKIIPEATKESLQALLSK